MTDESVRVAVRVRPLIQSEVDRGCQNCLNVIPSINQVNVRNDRAFTYNHVFGPESNQDEFYETAVSGMIEKLFKGYNVTILAYGQTGSGKTHSMGTSYTAGESMGVIPRSVKDIFNCIDSNDEYNYRVTVSFMELYNEQLYDLLADKSRRDCIVDIREDVNKEIKIIGVTEKEVSTAEEALNLLTQGSQGRATGSTAMNDQSSRSHAIFSMTVFQEPKDNPANATTAKFHLVDLAGSERSKKTQATGDRFKEGVNINKGLLALGNVISQLGDSAANSFVVYRDSKLTRLLQDSLGGNSITLMIACVSPADYNLDETLSTLRYADRAKKIKNKPVVNQDPTAAKINLLQAEVVNLRLALAGKGSLQECPPEHADLLDKTKALQKTLRDLMEKFNNQMMETMYMNERAELAENAKEKIYSGMVKILEELNEILKDQSLDKIYLDTIMGIKIKIHELLDEQKKINTEIHEHVSLEHIPSTKSQDSTANTDGEQHSFNGSIHLDEEHAEHTFRQAERNNEVQNVNRELAIKEELIARLLNNASQIAEHTKEVQDMELEIKNLQAEKDKLMHTLENVQANSASAKLAEARRKKVQELEKKISELTRKCADHNRVIKQKEKSDQQVKNLTNEIQTLKQTRVKLIREMRKEADKFSQYKLQREKEIYKLKDQDRKRQNQMNRLENQYSKQQNVYKRKIQEYAALNKRLKDSLELQSKAQQRREKNNSPKEGIEALITREYKEVRNKTNCECSLEKFMEDRKSYTKLLQQLNSQLADGSKRENLEEEINDVKEVIEVLNIQIAALQNQLMEGDKKKSSRWPEITSMGDYKTALKIAFDLTADNHRENWAKLDDYETIKNKYKELETKHDQKLMDCRQLELQNDNLKRELEEMKRRSEDLGLTKKKTSISKVKPVLQLSFNETFGDDSMMEFDDDEKDPDWHLTPQVRRTRNILQPVDGRDISGDNILKRSSNGELRCSCNKTNCMSRLCKCRKNSEVCNAQCGCSSNCHNRDPDKTGHNFFPADIETAVEIKRSRIDTEN
ncbi:chromosome-associated kinesin KIF4A [Microplitis mediator]|uniref:chromosome-associated kinesin KIF4A n=1 Tax=Microplitis mediator TaxID=375433 RepID=UPI0025579215|nr:chromosome-associated kinesin KIF4A [Microplitis mediator]